MSAVRSEVEELRDKISKLEDTVNHLSRENEVLRANVNPEVLASLLGNRSILGGLQTDPSSPSKPTLRPLLSCQGRNIRKLFLIHTERKVKYYLQNAQKMLKRNSCE